MTRRPPVFQWLGICLLMAASAGASAQRALQQPGTSADELLRLGLDALHQIDEDRSAALWNVAPSFVKAKFRQADFVSECTSPAHR